MNHTNRVTIRKQHFKADSLHVRFRMFFIVFQLSLLIPFSETSANQVIQDEFYVAYKKIDVASTSTDESFPMALVYPSETPSESVRFGPFEMDLSIGSKIAEGKFPLIIISHGSGGTNLGHRSIAFALVKRGYIVGMPLHPKNNFKNNQAEGTLKNWKNRPLHISSSIDALLFDQKLSLNIDFEKIAVIGHSAGGYTALASAGGVADTAHIIELCLSNPNVNEAFCGLVKDGRIRREKIENSRDGRIKAIVLMAPVGILFNSEDSLANVDIPALLLKAEKDAELTEPFQSDIIAKNYKNKERLIYCTVSNAGHYSFITPFPKGMETELGAVAEDPKGFDRIAFHESLGSDIANFLDGVFNTAQSKMLRPTLCLSG